MGEILFHAHSGLRYAVLAAAVVALVLLAAGGRGGRPLERGARISSAVFAGLLDLQVLLGIITLVARAWFPALAGHVAMMVLALVSAHGLRVAAKRAGSEPRRRAFALLAVAVPLVLIVGGILAIGRPLV